MDDEKITKIVIENTLKDNEEFNKKLEEAIAEEKQEKEKPQEKKKFKLSEQTMIEAQIGWTLGTLIGAAGAGVMVVGFTQLSWVWKAFTIVGELGILGNLVMALMAMIKMRKNLIIAQKQMNAMAASMGVKNEDYIG